VGVLVRVEMRNPDARRLYLSELRCRFGLDFFGAKAVGKRVFRQLLNGPVKESCLPNDQRWNLRCREHRPAIREYDMAADAENLVCAGREPLCQLNRVLEFVARGHQRCRGHNAALMALDDCAIHAASEAEIVGIYDEPLLSPSLAGC